MPGGGGGWSVLGGGGGGAMTEELRTKIKNAYKVNMVEILRVNEECVSSQIECNLHWLTRRDCRSKYEDGDRLENWGRREQ